MAKVRLKSNPALTGEVSEFNTHGLGEIVGGIGEDYDSWYIRDLEVLINGEWKDMMQAFKDKDLIPNNFNTRFIEADNQVDKERGYYF
jgi:hypothetical protein